MRPTSAAKHFYIVSLLIQGYPHHQIHAKTSVSLNPISKINKEFDSNKENNYGGHPSKLSAHDKQSIIHQITSGKLDNAVQATQSIHNTLINPVHPQTVRNALKEAGIWSATKKKVPMLKQTHQQRWLKFAHYHEN
jgi:transposase